MNQIIISFLCGLKEIINEAKDLQCVSVDDTVFQLKYYLEEI